MAREAAIFGEVVVDLEGLILGQGDELFLAAEFEQLGVVAHAVETVAVGHLVLAEEDVAGAIEGVGKDEAAATVVERGNGRAVGGCAGAGGWVRGSLARRVQGGMADGLADNQAARGGAGERSRGLCRRRAGGKKCPGQSHQGSGGGLSAHKVFRRRGGARATFTLS